MFTNYLPETIDTAGRLVALLQGFMASGKPGTFDENAVRVIAQRLQQNPARYIEFGPYWWALKQVLNDAGQDLGEHGAPLVASVYKGSSPIETLVMAEAFKDLYRARWFVGTQTFELSEGELYELTDPDMQARPGKP